MPAKSTKTTTAATLAATPVVTVQAANTAESAAVIVKPARKKKDTTTAPALAPVAEESLTMAPQQRVRSIFKSFMNIAVNDKRRALVDRRESMQKLVRSLEECAFPRALTKAAANADGSRKAPVKVAKGQDPIKEARLRMAAIINEVRANGIYVEETTQAADGSSTTTYKRVVGDAARQKEFDANLKKWEHYLTHDFSSIDAELKAFKRATISVNPQAGFVLSVILDEILTQLLKHAMDSALAAGARTVMPKHLLAEGLDKLSLAPLFTNLPCWAALRAHLEAVLNHPEEPEAPALPAAAAAEPKRGRGKKAAKDAATATAAAPVATPAPKKAPAPEPAFIVKDSHQFLSYVRAVFVYLLDPKKNRGFNQYNHIESKKDGKPPGHLSMSSLLHKFLAQLAVDFLSRLSLLVQLHLNAVHTKSVTDAPITAIAQTLLVDGEKPLEKLIRVDENVKRSAHKNPDGTETPATVERVSVYRKELSFENTRFHPLNTAIHSKLVDYGKYLANRSAARATKAAQ